MIFKKIRCKLENEKAGHLRCPALPVRVVGQSSFLMTVNS